MENLAIFYEILYGHLSPLTENQKDHPKYLNYLKKRYPECEKHYKVRLERTKHDQYKISHYQGFCFHELDNMVYHQGKKTDDPRIDIITDKICPQLGIVPENATCVAYETEENKVHLELTIAGHYDELPLQQARFYYYQVMLHEAVGDIRKQLHEKVSSFDTQDQISMHIRKYQAAIHAYMNTILHDHLPKLEHSAIYQLSEDYSTIDVFKIIYQNLEELLVYLEKGFFHCLDLNATLPYRNRLLFAIGYKNDVDSLLEKLAKANISTDLHNIIIAPLKAIVNKNHRGFSYKSMIYHEDYVNTFVHFFKQNLSFDEQAIVGVLCLLNLNGLQFFRYLTGRISKQVEATDILLEKLEILFYHQKQHNQTVVKTAYRFCQKLPSLKEQMAAWLCEEVGFYKRKFKFQVKESLLVSGITQSQPSKKEVLRLSVAQISLISRLFYETGNIEGTRMERLRFVSRNYSTTHTKNISLESLSKKYYQVTRDTKQSVRRVLMQMLDYLNDPTNFS